MQELEKLETSVLVDRLIQYTTEYSSLKANGANDYEITQFEYKFESCCSTIAFVFCE